MTTLSDPEKDTRVMPATANKRVGFVILVAALGYFVDIYDLLLFSIVRVTSLRDIGVPPDQLLSTGVFLLNVQMIGMLIGGVLWGVLGDKRGRLSVLFGSISLYSVANIANGFVTTVDAYAVLRLIAGIGLAGELGAGVTLVSESMSAERRGYGTTLVAAIGILGAVVAGLVGDLFSWRTAYFVGGAMGLCLLALRIGVFESGLFQQVAQTHVERGNFLSLFRNRATALRYLSVILVGLPVWYVIAILVTFSPEFGQAMGMARVPEAGYTVILTYAGGSVGGLLSGYLSQLFRNRKKVLLGFLIACGGLIALHFAISGSSLTLFYTMCVLLGLSVGYWALFATMAAEQFGTNIRATVATTVPNFVRGGVVPMTIAFQYGREYFGLLGSAPVIGLVVVVIAVLALRNVQETFGKDLNYVEER